MTEKNDSGLRVGRRYSPLGGEREAVLRLTDFGGPQWTRPEPQGAQLRLRSVSSRRFRVALTVLWGTGFGTALGLGIAVISMWPARPRPCSEPAICRLVVKTGRCAPGPCDNLHGLSSWVALLMVVGVAVLGGGIGLAVERVRPLRQQALPG